MPLAIKSSMQDQHQYAQDLVAQLQGLFENEATSATLQPIDTKIFEGLAQFYAIGISAEQCKPDENLEPEEISQIGEYGFHLLTQLLQWMQNHNQQTFFVKIRTLILSLCVWVTEHKGEIKTLEPAVDSLAQIANATQDINELYEVLDLMNTIIAGCAANIKNDIEDTNPMRPWRLLLLNRAIIATRTRDTELITNVYHELANLLPNDVSGFFNESMQEMDRRSYPDEVKQVVQEYFNRYSRSKMN